MPWPKVYRPRRGKPPQGLKGSYPDMDRDGWERPVIKNVRQAARRGFGHLRPETAQPRMRDSKPILS